MHLVHKATSATVVLHLVYLGIGSIPLVVVIVEKGIVDYNECYCAAPAVAWLGRAQIWIHVFHTWFWTAWPAAWPAAWSAACRALCEALR